MEEILERIDNRLSKMEERLDNIEQDCKKMDQHINFVESIYATIKTPFHYIMNRVTKIQNLSLEN